MKAFTDDQNKSVIQDKIRELQDKVPQLEDVDLYQRKDDLIQEANAALEAFTASTSDDALQGDIIEDSAPADISAEPEPKGDELEESKPETSESDTDAETQDGPEQEETPQPYSLPEKSEFLL